MPCLLSFIRTHFHPLWRLRKSPAFRLFQDHCDFDIFARIPETKGRVALKLIRDASWLLNASGLEPEIRAVFLDVFRDVKPKHFWDVGSNIGFYSWFTLAHCPGAEALLFEADTTNYRLSLKTIQRRRLRRARAFNVAVSDSIGTIDFLADPVSGATGSIAAVANLENVHSLHHAYGLSRVKVVNSITLDSMVAQGYAPPDLLKIDVEGAEHLVLAGARKLIEDTLPVIIMETDQSDLLEWLESVGYRVQPIDAGNFLCLRKQRLRFEDGREATSQSNRRCAQEPQPSSPAST